MTNQVFYPIGNNLGIIGQEIMPDSGTVAVSGNSNYMFICDDSGSMYGEMRELTGTVKRLIRNLQNGDTLTIARFSSSNGDYNYFIKALPITDNMNFSSVDRLIDQNLTASNMTCYTEVLNEAKNVISEIQKVSTTSNFSLAFLSDGMPNDRSPHSAIFAAIEAIKGLINQSFIIGYGRYYNKTLMNEMASRLGATLVHNDSDRDFDVTFTQFITNKPQGKNLLVQIKTPSEFMFYLTPKGEVVRVKPDENGEVLYPMSKMKNYIYSIVKDTLLPLTAESEDSIRAYYGAALVLNQSLRTVDALRTLSAIGDKFLVDQLAKAFTVSQFGVAESMIANAITDKKTRFLTGKHLNCLPDENAFCFLDLIDILQQDKTLMFYPNDTRFVYKRIGRRSLAPEDAKTFKENQNDGYKINEIVLNQTRPNVSLRIIKEGKVKLGEPGSQEYKDREALNARNRKAGLETLPNQFETFTFRNYAIVADGDYNITRLPISMSEDTYLKLKDAGLIAQNERYGSKKIFLLEIKDLPIVSRKYSNREFLSKEMAEQFTQIQLLKINQSTTKFFLTNLKPLAVEPPNEFETRFGPEGAAILKAAGITPKNGYSAKGAQEDASDYYLAKEFAITMSGFSTISIPKYLEKRKKVEDFKKTPTGKQPTYTTSEKVIDQFYSELVNIDGKDVEEIVTKVEARLNTIKDELKSLEHDLNYEKIAMLLTNSNFSDVAERGEVTVDVDDYSVKLDMKETTVYF